jgi:hypothetical protein
MIFKIMSIKMTLQILSQGLQALLQIGRDMIVAVGNNLSKRIANRIKPFEDIILIRDSN